MSLIDKYLVKLIYEEPFYSRLSRKINKEESNRVPTAGVYAKDGKFFLVWCQKYLETLSELQAIELLKHEFLHISLGHCTNRKRLKKNKEPDIVWYWACDFAINSLLNHLNLPPGGLVPGTFPSIPLEQQQFFDKDFLERRKKLENLIRSLPVGKSADWYYFKLNEDEEIRKAIEEMDKQFRGTDCHNNWNEDITEEDIRELEEKSKEILKDAVEYSDKNQSWGTVPVNVISSLRKVVAGFIDWRNILLAFCGSVRSSERAMTFKRMSRRVPDLMPGFKRVRTAKIVVAVDQSSSVLDSQLEEIFSVLSNLAEIVEFTVVPFDVTVNNSFVFIWKKGQKIKFERVKSGGTNFSAPTKWFNKRKDRYDALIIITDGEAPKPVYCHKKRAWITLPGKKLLFNTNEMVIKIN